MSELVWVLFGHFFLGDFSSMSRVCCSDFVPAQDRWPGMIYFGLGHSCMTRLMDAGYAFRLASPT